MGHIKLNGKDYYKTWKGSDMARKVERDFVMSISSLDKIDVDSCRKIIKKYVSVKIDTNPEEETYYIGREILLDLEIYKSGIDVIMQYNKRYKELVSLKTDEEIINYFDKEEL